MRGTVTARKDAANVARMYAAITVQRKRTRTWTSIQWLFSQEWKTEYLTELAKPTVHIVISYHTS